MYIIYQACVKNSRAMNLAIIILFVVIIIITNLVIRALAFTQKAQHKIVNISEDADPP